MSFFGSGSGDTDVAQQAPKVKKPKSAKEKAEEEQKKFIRDPKTGKLKVDPALLLKGPPPPRLPEPGDTKCLVTRFIVGERCECQITIKTHYLRANLEDQMAFIIHIDEAACELGYRQGLYQLQWRNISNGQTVTKDVDDVWRKQDLWSAFCAAVNRDPDHRIYIG